MALGFYKTLGCPGRFCSWGNHSRDVRAGGGPHLELQLFAREINFLRTLMSSLHFTERLSPPRASFLFFNFFLGKFSNIFKGSENSVIDCLIPITSFNILQILVHLTTSPIPLEYFKAHPRPHLISPIHSSVWIFNLIFFNITTKP